MTRVQIHVYVYISSLIMVVVHRAYTGTSQDRYLNKPTPHHYQNAQIILFTWACITESLKMTADQLLKVSIIMILAIKCDLQYVHYDGIKYATIIYTYS